MKTLLLTNDDGILARGLQCLKSFLSQYYDVYVAAPDRERSGVSMALTIDKPLRMNQVAEKEFAVSGTPVDCVNVALQGIMPARPDFIISGMNEGENLCEDVFFSGTVAGAFVGHMYGIPAMATSLLAGKTGDNPSFAFEAGARITARVLEKLLPITHNSVVYNLNIPPDATGESKIAITSLGLKRYQPSLVERTDPRGRKYFWIGTGAPNAIDDRGTDLHAVANGYAALSILKYDLNDSREMEKLTEAFNEI
jgi:5'-nucleotidase